MWQSVPKTLDFGVGIPIETAAVGPLLCDDCQHLANHEQPGYDALCLCGIRKAVRGE